MVRSRLAHNAMRALIALALAACAGGKPAPVAAPASSDDAPVPTATSSPSAAPSVASTAAPWPADAPPRPEELGRHFREPNPLTHVAAYVVDEPCLMPDHLPLKVQQASKVGLTDLQEDGLHWTSADTNTVAASELADLRAFVASFPKGKSRFVITSYEWGIDGNVRTGFRALCLQQKPLFAGPSQMGRIRHKDGTHDEDKYRVGLADSALKKIQALPRGAVRLAILWDDALLVLLPIDKLKELTSPALTLAPMPPP